MTLRSVPSSLSFSQRLKVRALSFLQRLRVRAHQHGGQGGRLREGEILARQPPPSEAGAALQGLALGELRDAARALLPVIVRLERLGLRQAGTCGQQAQLVRTRSFLAAAIPGLPRLACRGIVSLCNFMHIQRCCCNSLSNRSCLARVRVWSGGRSCTVCDCTGCCSLNGGFLLLEDPRLLLRCAAAC